MSEFLETPTPDNQGDILLDRNDWLEKQIDPSGTLPKVNTLILDANMDKHVETLPADIFDGNAGSIYISALGEADTIGDVVFGWDKNEPKKLVLTDVSILPSVQGQGYGRRLYLEALKALPKGYGAVSHSMLSPDAQNVWNWLIEIGVAKERNGAVQGQLGKYETVF